MGEANVLHLFDRRNSLIAQHVAMLGYEADAAPAASGKKPLIVHVHGCWNRSVVRQALRLHRQGARLVLSPHGQLEPWIIDQQRMTEKTAKILLWQRRVVSLSYALIAHGSMEAAALQRLGWNPRIETIGNAVITNTITPEAMIRQTQAIYQKVMDSHTLELLSADMQQLMAELIKAGVTGDSRWVPSPSDYEPSTDEWRLLLLYADHQHIRATIDKGIQVLGRNVPPIDTSQIAAYLPADSQQPALTGNDILSITEHAHRMKLTKFHLVSLASALRRPDVDDEQIAASLSEHHLTRYFQRLLQILREQTLLEEGFMPLTPQDDRQTQQLRRQLTPQFP